MAKSFRNAGNTLPVFIGKVANEMEAMTTAVLSTLLGITTRTSIVLGCGSASLSLQQKVRLIQEIHGIDKTVGEKMMRLVQIINMVTRANIESVDEIFAGTGLHGKEIYQDLDKWYFAGIATELTLQDRDSRIQPILLSMLWRLKKHYWIV